MGARVVLITGGAKRVGAAICRRLHAAGADLMVHYRSSVDEARALQDELNAQRADSVALVRADLLRAGAAATLVADTVERFGGIDVLVNNASSFYSTPVGEITEQAWDDLVGTNLKAPLFLSQASAPHLRRRQAGFRHPSGRYTTGRPAGWPPAGSFGSTSLASPSVLAARTRSAAGPARRRNGRRDAGACPASRQVLRHSHVVCDHSL